MDCSEKYNQQEKVTGQLVGPCADKQAVSEGPFRPRGLCCPLTETLIFLNIKMDTAKTAKGTIWNMQGDVNPVRIWVCSKTRFRLLRPNCSQSLFIRCKFVQRMDRRI